MSNLANISSEFVNCTKALSEMPDNYSIKSETLGRLSSMKALAASGDAMAQYRLAQIYPKNSPSYLTLMQAAADQGLTNAMLALSLACTECNSQSSLKEAARNLVKIFASNDSYIKSEAAALVETNHSLATEVQCQMKTNHHAKSSFGFFAYESRPIETEQFDLEKTQAISK